MKTYLFASSRKPDKLYRTVLHDNGAVTCGCPAFRECWHIKAVRERPIVGRTELTDVAMADQGEILALLEDGNDEGARVYILALFPSMTLEEIDELAAELRPIEDDDIPAIEAEEA